MFLSKDNFSQVIAHTPLVSIDLVVRNSQGDILLGERRNRPAKGYWFVPGGRIQKNESLNEAFRRLTQEELGQSVDMGAASFLGVYEHFYDDHVFGDEINTHYVVLAYILNIDNTDLNLNTQHQDWQWFTPEKLLADPKVHEYSKAYFSGLIL